jgi:hypothetical protein
LDSKDGFEGVWRKQLDIRRSSSGLVIRNNAVPGYEETSRIVTLPLSIKDMMELASELNETAGKPAPSVWGNK